MVHYPPTTRYAASGGDDAGITNGIEFDGVFDFARIHSLLINALALGGVVPVVFVKVTENIGALIAVGQKSLAQFVGCASTVNFSMKSIFDPRFQVTRTINMGVGQHNGFNPVWSDWKMRTGYAGIRFVLSGTCRSLAAGDAFRLTQDRVNLLRVPVQPKDCSFMMSSLNQSVLTSVQPTDFSRVMFANDLVAIFALQLQPTPRLR
jgi:hypothetical protein